MGQFDVEVGENKDVTLVHLKKIIILINYNLLYSFSILKFKILN